MSRQAASICAATAVTVPSSPRTSGGHVDDGQRVHGGRLRRATADAALDALGERYTDLRRRPVR